MKQLEVALFQKGKFAAKFVVAYVDDVLPSNWKEKYLDRIMKVFNADGYRAEWGVHNRTSVIDEHNAGPRK